MNATIKTGKIKWNVDSGATIHCTNDRNLITRVYKDHPPIRLTVANGHKIIVTVVGDALITLIDEDGNKREEIIHNVCYHETFHENLISVARLKRDNEIACVFSKTDFLLCLRTGKAYPFSYKGKYLLETALSAVIKTYEHLHSRFGHCSPRRLKKLSTRSTNFPSHNLKTYFHDPSECDACMQGGSKRKPFKTRKHNRFTYFGERLHSDLCGPFPKSILGYRYILVVVDAATGASWVYFLKSKSSAEVKEGMQHFLTTHRTSFIPGKQITWYTDNGGEFMSTDMDEFCEEFAIRRGFSVPYAPPQNAAAERMWGILLRTTRIILAQSGVDQS